MQLWKIPDKIISCLIFQKLQYSSEHSLIQDFELMFSNAKHYNEEGSRVYKDAITLEKALKKKLQTIRPLGDSPIRIGKPG